MDFNITEALEQDSRIKTSTVDLKIFDDYLYKADEKKLKIKILESHLQSLEDNRKARKKYASAVSIYVGAYILIVLGIFCVYQFHFALMNVPTAPIITLLTTTTANVIAALLIVIKYLFPNSKK